MGSTTDMTRKRRAADLLRKAKGVLDDLGWTQLKFRDSEGRVCLAGALHETAGCEDWVDRSGLDEESHDCKDVVNDAICFIEEHTLPDNVTDWNDMRAGQKSDVKHLLDHVATRLERKP